MVDQAGLHVFPCKADKTPCIRGGHNSATNDLKIIRQWWGHALLGAPTGPVNGFDVLDIDRGGEDWLMNYECSHGPLPATRIVGTQSGGVHYYWQHRPGMKCSAGLLAPNIDIRGAGGYVILWDRADCKVLSDAPVAPWPGPMLELLREAEEARRQRYSLAPKPAGVGVTACHGLLPRPLWSKLIELMSGAADLNHRRASGILRPVAEARENRNWALYYAALQFRELIRDGIIIRTSVEELLFMAMEINGYVEEKLNGEYRAKGTIKSGLNAKRYG